MQLSYQSQVKRNQLTYLTIAMTHSVSDSFPTHRTTSFSTNDDVAISWIEIGDYLRYAHHVSWNGYSPDGKLFKKNTHTTSVPDVGYYYEWHRTGSPLPISGYNPASMPGLWKVEVYIYGDYWLIEWFSIRSDNH